MHDHVCVQYKAATSKSSRNRSDESVFILLICQQMYDVRCTMLYIYNENVYKIKCPSRKQGTRELRVYAIIHKVGIRAVLTLAVRQLYVMRCTRSANLIVYFTLCINKQTTWNEREQHRDFLEANQLWILFSVYTLIFYTPAIAYLGHTICVPSKFKRASFMCNKTCVIVIVARWALSTRLEEQFLL